MEKDDQQPLHEQKNNAYEEDNTKKEENELKTTQEQEQEQPQPQTLDDITNSVVSDEKAENNNNNNNAFDVIEPIITPEPIISTHPPENVHSKPHLRPLKLNTSAPQSLTDFSQTLPASLPSHTSNPLYNKTPSSNTLTFSPSNSKSLELSSTPQSPSDFSQTLPASLPSHTSNISNPLYTKTPSSNTLTFSPSKSSELSKSPSSPPSRVFSTHTSLSVPALMPSYSQSPPGSPTLRPARMPPLQTSSSLPHLPPRTLFNPYSNSILNSPPILSPSSHRSSTPLSVYRDSGNDDVLGDQASESDRDFGGFNSMPNTPSQQSNINISTLTPLITVLKSPKSSETDKVECFESLLTLAENNNNKILMAKAGVLPPLVHFLMKGTPMLKSQSTNLTRLLSRCEENKELMVQAGVLDPLVKILSGTGDLSFDENSKINAAGAISNLGFRLENKLTMVKAGALELLLDLINNGKPQAQEYAVLALYNLTHKNEQAKTQLFQLPFLPVLVELLRKGTYEAKVQTAKLLQILACTEERQLTIVQSGVLDPLVLLLYSETDKAKAQATKTIQNLALSHNNKICIISAGALGPLGTLLEFGAEKLRETASHVIRILSTGIGSMNETNNNNNMPDEKSSPNPKQEKLDKPKDQKFNNKNNNNNNNNNNKNLNNASGATYISVRNQTSLSNKEAILKASLVHPLVGVLKSGTDRAKVHAALALHNLIHTDASCAQILEGGILPPLVAMMKVGDLLGGEDGRLASIRTVRKLLHFSQIQHLNSPENMWVTSGVFESLGSALTATGGLTPTKEEAAFALAKLTVSHHNCVFPDAMIFQCQAHLLEHTLPTILELLRAGSRAAIDLLVNLSMHDIRYCIKGMNIIEELQTIITPESPKSNEENEGVPRSPTPFIHRKNSNSKQSSMTAHVTAPPAPLVKRQVSLLVPDPQKNIYTSKDPDIKMDISVILVNVVDGSDVEPILGGLGLVRNVVALLKELIDNKNKAKIRYRYGIRELVKTISNLSHDDFGKIILGEEGVIELFLKILNGEGNWFQEATNSHLPHPKGSRFGNNNNNANNTNNISSPPQRANSLVEEIRYICSLTLWNLAFDVENRTLIVNDGGVEILKNVCKGNNNESSGTRQNAKGLLWLLGINQSDDALPIVQRNQTIVLIYHPERSQQVHAIARGLEELGYTIHITSHHQILPSINILETCALLLVCVSRQLKGNPLSHCQVEYALRLNKEILPLMLLPDYIPDGWIVRLLSRRVWYDFRDSLNFEGKMMALVADIGNRGKSQQRLGIGRAPSVSNLTLPRVKGADDSQRNSEYKPHDEGTNINGWTVEDVVVWLKMLGMTNYFDTFRQHHMDGRALLMLKGLMAKDSKIYYQWLEDKFQINKAKDLLHFSEALMQLVG